MHERSNEDALAPVTYLPWATPGVDAGAGDVRRPRSTARAGDDAAVSESGSEPGAQAGGRPGADARGAHPSRGSRRGLRSASVRGVRTDDDSEAADETGAERDARIDRLVVGRLRRSSLSVAEVRSVLAEHGLDEAEIEEWIERYERLGYLDDVRLAEQLVHTNAARRGKGSGAILAELGRRGVDPAAARAAVEELDPELERENALQVARRRSRQLAGLDRRVAERRLSAFLQRRGYTGEVIREAVADALVGDAEADEMGRGGEPS
ncbi:regulatory protein RecX [Agromyces sp. G08B096]|uniref:Regulatory protein RecX n=1 Tax=Agromyces sp. G08B096 TaxID=3156399 RepID=A0AAU7W2P6_9MICO